MEKKYRNDGALFCRILGFEVFCVQIIVRIILKVIMTHAQMIWSKFYDFIFYRMSYNKKKWSKNLRHCQKFFLAQPKKLFQSAFASTRLVL